MQFEHVRPLMVVSLRLGVVAFVGLREGVGRVDRRRQDEIGRRDQLHEDDLADGDSGVAAGGQIAHAIEDVRHRAAAVEAVRPVSTEEGCRGGRREHDGHAHAVGCL
jgi:hypothetical protein